MTKPVESSPPSTNPQTTNTTPPPPSGTIHGRTYTPAVMPPPRDNDVGQRIAAMLHQNGGYPSRLYNA